MSKAIFITATDTGVGKTIVTCGIGLSFRKKGLNVGVMKPFQSAGADADFLIKTLEIKDEKELVNSYYAKDPVAPIVALRRANLEVSLEKIFATYQELQKRHDFLIVEGVGGLLTPLAKNYLICDLIRDLDIPLLIVARPSLGTLNHTLLTYKYAQDYGLDVRGVIINGLKSRGLAEKTNPLVLKEFGAPLLGIISYIKNVKSKAGLLKLEREFAKNVDVGIFLQEIASSASVARLRNDSGGSLRGAQATKQSHSAVLARKDKEFLWHPFTQMQDWLKDEPLVIEEAKGVYLKDTQGRWYLDGVSSLWVNVHGHRHPAINAAVKRQLNKLEHSTLLGLSNIPAIELAEKLVNIAPAELKKVFYSESGSTAVEIALKMAYQYWQHLGLPKTKFIHLENSYHGDTIGAVSVGGIDLFHKIYKNLLFESFKADSPYCYRCPKGKNYPLCAFECLDSLKEILEKHYETCAALIVEPLVQAAGGILVWPVGIYKEMERLCREYNILLIADEVAVGFGRTGAMFASEVEDVCPDILCLAKGITGGYLPLAATLTTQKIFDAFLSEYKEQKTFFHGHTYTGNPLSCAAALANLDIFKKEKTLERLQFKISLLKEELEKFKDLKSVGDIRQKGFIAGIELVKDKKTREPYPWEDGIGIKVCQKAREFAVLLRPLGNVIVIIPPLSINGKEFKNLLSAAIRAIHEVTYSAASSSIR